MTEHVTLSRRRAEEAFYLLTHPLTAVERDITDAETAAQERALKTQILRQARLERDRNPPPLSPAVRKSRAANGAGAKK